MNGIGLRPCCEKFKGVGAEPRKAAEDLLFLSQDRWMLGKRG
jgi:hypothetical protein